MRMTVAHRPTRIRLGVFLLLAITLSRAADVPDDETRGQYFSRKTYTPEPLPTFAEVRDNLPKPILDGRPELVDMYWKSWELAFQHLKPPPPGSPLVSNYLDAAFNGNLFQWDTVFMMMFARYAHHEFRPSSRSIISTPGSTAVDSSAGRFRRTAWMSILRGR
jgi:hypothetical protein